MNELVLLPLSERHLPQAVEIEGLSFTAPWSEALIGGEISNPLSVFQAAELCGRLVGYVDLLVILDEGHIANLAVHPEMRRRGIAAALLSWAVDYAKTKGLRSLTLEVRESNAAARALYTRFGFKIVGRRPRYYENPVEDAILMTLELCSG